MIFGYPPIAWLALCWYGLGRCWLWLLLGGVAVLAGGLAGILTGWVIDVLVGAALPPRLVDIAVGIAAVAAMLLVIHQERRR